MVSTDKLYELTVRKVDGKPAPDFDTFIWGWGGDPYDPSFLLSILTTGEIGGSSDSFYSNPEYDRLFDEQAGEFDTEARKEMIQRDGRAHPGRPALPGAHRGPEPAGLPDRPDRDVEPICPAARPATCSATRSPTSRCWRSQPARAAPRAATTAAAPAIVLVVARGAGRRRIASGGPLSPARGREPAGARRVSDRGRVELARAEGTVSVSGTLARGQGRRGGADARSSSSIFNFFLFRVMGDPTTQLARLPQATPEEIEQLRADYGLDKPLLPASSPTTSATR